MLIEFRVENHRSIRDEQILTFASDGSFPDDRRLRHLAPSDDPLLPTLALYGGNASGKSNMLSALEFMCDAVKFSQRAWDPDAGVDRDPFAWGPHRQKPSTFEVVLIADGVRFTYGFVVNDEEIIEEWLFAFPKGRRQVWFSREGNAIKLTREHMSAEAHTARGVTRANSLFLSTGMQLGLAEFRPLWRWFSGYESMNLFPKPNLPRWSRFGRWVEAIAEGPEADRLMFQSFLRRADLGILDFRVEPNVNPGRPPRVWLKHQSEENGDGDGDNWLPFHLESRGTQVFTRMARPLMAVLRSGALLVVDELEASLHPLLASYVLEIFDNQKTNPHNAQLLFATHDTNLLGRTLPHKPLRRDQVWLAEKRDDGSSCIYPLTKFRPRKNENLERGYLQGRYGAVPFLSALDDLDWDGSP